MNIIGDVFGCIISSGAVYSEFLLPTDVCVY